MATVNVFVKGSDSIPRIADVMIMCPVEDTGKNSVNPSTIDRMIASRKDIRYLFSFGV